MMPMRVQRASLSSMLCVVRITEQPELPTLLLLPPLPLSPPLLLFPLLLVWPCTMQDYSLKVHDDDSKDTPVTSARR